MRVLSDVRVPMRDGVELSLDVLLPDDPGAPLPVALVRTPYDKTIQRADAMDLIELLIERGYGVAINDCRGRFNSDGEFFPYWNEHADGHDTVEWIAEQEWCDGNVGMFGSSYVGQTQWYAASEVPPHLRAIVPTVSPPSSLWRNEPFINGIFRVCCGEWMLGMGRRSWQIPDFVHQAYSEQREYYDSIPFADLDREAGVESTWWQQWMTHPTYDDFWRHSEYGRYAEMTVPALNVSGWWDMNFPGAPENFEAMRREAASEEGRAGQKLLIGPWPHIVNQKAELSGLDFGPDAVIDLNAHIVRFYDRWLKGIENGVESEKPVKVFVLGANRWREEESWPLPGTEEVPFYLHSGGAANSLLGDGVLSREAPSAEEQPDRYTYDPADVHKSLWQLAEGPVDDRVATAREDCLCYSTPVLVEPLEAVGWVSCRLWAASSALDTDWHARLVDVHPDGSARFLCHGMLRARFRNSLSEPELLTPGEPTLFEFAMDACGIRFEPGHRVRVEIASAWFTQWDRNLNSGAENNLLDDRVVVAEQTVFHDPEHPSCVVLPLVPPPSA
ncbi:MAG: CocE/NonD family hydrolase [Solirubrobacterales bacterium]